MKKKPTKPKEKKPDKRPAHRPSGVGRMDIDKIEMYAGRGLNKEQVAQCLGISRRVFFKYQEENPEFAEAYDRGRAKATAVIAGKLLQKVETGSLVAIIFWLKCQAGWKETNGLELTGKDGEPITFMDNV